MHVPSCIGNVWVYSLEWWSPGIVVGFDIRKMYEWMSIQWLKRLWSKQDTLAYNLSARRKVPPSALFLDQVIASNEQQVQSVVCCFSHSCVKSTGIPWCSVEGIRLIFTCTMDARGPSSFSEYMWELHRFIRPTQNNSSHYRFRVHILMEVREPTCNTGTQAAPGSSYRLDNKFRSSSILPVGEAREKIAVL